MALMATLTLLCAVQVLADANIAVLRNSKVQTAANGSRFIEIRPITVLSAVPEPATYGLMLAGLAVVAAVARRKRTR